MSGPVNPTVHQQSVNAQQLQMYGENWADRLGRLLRGYGISQSRLAAVIGLSAPMISQLITGARVKISNPAVYGRIVRLEELLASPVANTADAGERARILDDVAASHPALTTLSMPVGPSGGSPEQQQQVSASPPDRVAARRYLNGLADGATLRETAAAAELLGGGALAALLREAIDPARAPNGDRAHSADRAPNGNRA